MRTLLTDVSFRCVSQRCCFGLGARTTRSYGFGQLAGLLGTAVEQVQSGDGGKPGIFVTVPVVFEGQTKDEKQEPPDCETNTNWSQRARTSGSEMENEEHALSIALKSENASRTWYCA